jgi:hypothetical protein
MGYWGVGGFENDFALDWSLEFEDADLETGLKLIRDALNGDEDELALAAAEMVAIINGHPVPPPPDTHHLDEIVVDEEAEPLSREEMAAETERVTRELGMAIAEAVGRPGEVFIFEETETFYGTDEDDDEEPYVEPAMEWITRTHPARDAQLTELARRAVARISAPDSLLSRSWFEDETGHEVASEWRSYMDVVAAKLAE